MRKLKLQIQMTLDGFVAGPNGELDWMWLTPERDPNGFKKIIELTETIGTIIMGRKMVPGFIQYWENVVDNQPNSPEHSFAQTMVNTPKIAFSKTEKNIKGRNLTTENGDLVAAINLLKQQPGKDIMAYGGANFASSLISNNLVDEYYIVRNPVAIGKGLSIFNDQKQLKLVEAIVFTDGKMLDKYVPV